MKNDPEILEGLKPACGAVASRCAASLIAIAIAALPFTEPAAGRSAGVQPPCEGNSVPGYGRPGQAPTYAILDSTTIDQVGWKVPVCTGWPPAARSQAVVAVAGSFNFSGPIDVLLGRIAAISQLPHDFYWSASTPGWRPIATDAYALTGADPARRGPDFSPSKLVTGAQLYYWENDSRTGKGIYRMTVRERADDHVVIATENLTPIAFALYGISLAMSKPGQTQNELFLTRTSPDVWAVFILVRLGDGSVPWFLPRSKEEALDKSLANHAVATFRRIAGIPTNLEPPAIRE